MTHITVSVGSSRGESVDQAEFAKAIGSGRQFAERVRSERQERGWSQAELSRRMRAAGYPVDQAAISKIEAPSASERPRRIDIDEAIGFARVFDLSLEQMTLPPRQSDAMIKLVKAQKHLTSIDRDRETAMRQRDDAIRAALADGATYATIREITGMSPSTIAKAIKR